MQIQTAFCVSSNAYGWRAASTWPRLELHLLHEAISTHTGRADAGLWLAEMNFSVQVSSAPTLAAREDILQKYTCRNSKHIYLGVPDFMKPVRDGGWKEDEKRKEKKRELSRHQGSYFLFLCFLPLLSQGGFRGSELLILSLHSICTACHFYQIICGISPSTGHILLIRYLHFTLLGIQSLATVTYSKFNSHLRLK